MNKEEARLKAIKYATEKGWEENEVSYLTKDENCYVFNLYMPEGDFGFPCGVFVEENVCEISKLTSEHIFLLCCNRIREMIARCEWKFAKTMPFAPHEYIVRNKCPLTDEEFVEFVDVQRRFGVKERWGKYNNPYLYIDDYKYWTMGAPIEETTVINRAKACVVDDVHELYKGIELTKMFEPMHTTFFIEEYISDKLGLKEDNKAFNIGLISGRLKEISECIEHLERMRTNYCRGFMKEWSQRLSKDFPNHKLCEFVDKDDIVYTGITIPYKDIPDAIAIRIQAEEDRLFYGLTYTPRVKEMRDEIQENLNYVGICNNFIKGKDWLYYKYVSYDKGYEMLNALIKIMTNIGNNLENR